MTDLTALVNNPSAVTDEQLAELPTKLTRDEFLALEPDEREAILTTPDASEHQELSDEDIEAAVEVSKDETPTADATPKEEAKAESPEPAAEAQPPAPFVYIPKVPDTSGLAPKKQEIATAQTELDAKFVTLDEEYEKGEKTGPEYSRAQRALLNEQRDLDRRLSAIERDEADAAARARHGQEKMAQMWEGAVAATQSDPANVPLYAHPELGQRAREAFVEFSKSIAAIENRAGRQHDFGWFARETNGYVMRMLAPEIEAAGLKLGAAPAKAPPADAPKKPNRDPDLSKVPTTLRNTPAADDPPPAGEFAEVDSLRGAKYMRALEQMTPAQRERYDATH